MGFEVFRRRVDVSLDHARAVIDGARAEARRREIEPLVVVVLDAGGVLISADAEDGAGSLRLEVAAGKASAALGFGVSSGTIAGRTAGREGFVSGVAAASRGQFVPAAGGVLILGEGNVVIGAVGASGDSPDNDQACVLAGLEAAGLTMGLDAAEI